MSAIEATTGTYRSRVDGTLVLQVEIELRHAQAALALFGMPGTSLALARLKTPSEAAKESKQLKEGPRRKLGPICEWLVYRCKEPEFQQWLRGPYDRAMGGDGNGWGDVTPDEYFSGSLEDYTRHAVLVLCGVTSRSEIDGNHDAEARFESLIRRPWAAHTTAAARHAIADR